MSILHYSLRTRPYGLRDEVNHRFARNVDASAGEVSSAMSRQWAPRVDIHEHADRFVILADIPGVDPQDIHIQMDKGVLSLHGERKAELDVPAGHAWRAERAQGVFHRQFTLPDSADADGITAIGQHGVLQITIPKQAEAAPRRIQVQ